MNRWTNFLASLWMVFVIVTVLAGFNACTGDKKQEQAAPSAGGPSTPTSEAAISGTVTLGPDLKDKVGKAPLLMIVASPSSDPKKPALVVKREADVTFPYPYKLTAEDITLVGSSFVGKLYVSARIDSAGTIGPPRPGTFGGAFSGNPVPVGSSNVNIVIDKAY